MTQNITLGVLRNVWSEQSIKGRAVIEASAKRGRIRIAPASLFEMGIIR